MTTNNNNNHLTKEQIRRLIPLVKMEIGNQSKNYTNAMIVRNRYQDLYNSERSEKFNEKVDEYAKSMAIFEMDIENLEVIEKTLEAIEELENIEQSD